MANDNKKNNKTDRKISNWKRRLSSSSVKEDMEDKVIYGNLPLEGLTYKTCVTEKFLNRKKYIKDEDGNIRSKIPGTIKNVAVKLHQEVEENDILCILDAMKMNNEITSPIHGIVETINVKIGQNVAKNHILFHVSPLDEVNMGKEIIQDESAEEFDSAVLT